MEQLEHLSESLRIAAADPPPAGIDLDTLIEGEHRAARRRRWMVAIAGTCAAATTMTLGVAAVAGYGPSARGTPGGDDPSKSPAVDALPPWLPTEPATSAIPRLSAAFSHALLEVYAGVPTADLPTFEPALDTNLPASADPPADAPGGSAQPGATAQPGPAQPGTGELSSAEPNADVSAPAGSGKSPGAPAAEPNPYPAPLIAGGPESGYKGLVKITDRVGFSTVMIVLQPVPRPYPTECPPADRAVQCELRVEPDGSTVIRTTTAILGGGVVLTVDVFRIDGTHLSVIEDTHETEVGSGTTSPEPAKTPVRTSPTRPSPILTMDQLAQVGSDPALTLFP